MSAAAYPVGSTMKSVPVRTLPYGVVTKSLPGVAAAGTVTVRLVVGRGRDGAGDAAGAVEEDGVRRERRVEVRAGDRDRRARGRLRVKVVDRRRGDREARAGRDGAVGVRHVDGARCGDPARARSPSATSCVAAVTVADVPPEPPNLTVFDAGVAMKFVPVTTTDEPRLPLVGAKDETVGGAAWATPVKTSIAASASSATPAFRALIFQTVTSIPFSGVAGMRRQAEPGGWSPLRTKPAGICRGPPQKGDSPQPGRIRASTPPLPTRSRSTTSPDWWSTSVSSFEGSTT